MYYPKNCVRTILIMPYTNNREKKVRKSMVNKKSIGILILITIVALVVIIKPIVSKSLEGIYRLEEDLYIEDMYLSITKDKDGYIATYVDEAYDDGVRFESSFHVSNKGNGNRYRYDPTKPPKITLAVDLEYALRNPDIYDEFVVEAPIYGFEVERTTDEFLVSKRFHDLEEFRDFDGFMIDLEFEPVDRHQLLIYSCETDEHLLLLKQ